MKDDYLTRNLGMRQTFVHSSRYDDDDDDDAKGPYKQDDWTVYSLLGTS